MNDGAILNIRSRSYVYRRYIAAYHGSVPNAGMIRKRHVAHYDCTGTHKGG